MAASVSASRWLPDRARAGVELDRRRHRRCRRSATAIGPAVSRHGAASPGAAADMARAGLAIFGCLLSKAVRRVVDPGLEHLLQHHQSRLEVGADAGGTHGTSVGGAVRCASSSVPERANAFLVSRRARQGLTGCDRTRRYRAPCDVAAVGRAALRRVAGSSVRRAG